MSEDTVDVYLKASEWHRIVEKLRAGGTERGFALVMHEGDVALGLVVDGRVGAILTRPEHMIH
jgi:hypothetical protein